MKQKQMKLWTAALMAVLLISVLTVPIFAETNDPIEVINNLSRACESRWYGHARLCRGADRSVAQKP